MLDAVRDGLFDQAVPWFVVAQVLALGAATLVFGRRLRAGGEPRTGLLSAAMVAGVVVGAVSLGPLLRLPRTLLGSGGDLFAPGWLMAYGALAGGAVAVAVAAGRQRGAALDAYTPAAGVMVAIGRLGCVASGCCFGHADTGPLAIAYPPGTLAFSAQVAEGVLDPSAHAAQAVLPVALLESLVGALVILIGLTLPKRLRSGSTFVAGACVYAAGRFVIETMRDDPRPMAGPLSLPQALSLTVLAISAWAWSRSR